MSRPQIRHSTLGIGRIPLIKNLRSVLTPEGATMLGLRESKAVIDAACEAFDDSIHRSLVRDHAALYSDYLNPRVKVVTTFSDDALDEAIEVLGASDRGGAVYDALVAARNAAR